MNKLNECFKSEEKVQRFIKLRHYILNNPQILEELKIKLSHNEAKYLDLKHEIIIDEYIDLKKEIHSDLEMLKYILENGIKDDFAE